MDKRVIVVTGSSGRIGSALVKRLGENYHIVGFERLKALYASANEELIPVDISSEECLHQAFNHIKTTYGTKIAAVIHLAAYYSFTDLDYKKYQKITVNGTKSLLKILQDFEVEQFLFSSTMLVHKPCNPGQGISERWPLLPKWAYPRSKVATEKVIHKYRGNIPTVIMRISGVYDDMCHSIPIANQIQRIHEGHLTSRLFPGDITHGSAFMHMDDLVEAIMCAFEKRHELPREVTMLMGEDKTFSTDYLQREISRLLTGKEFKTWRIPRFLAWFGSWIQCHTPFMKKPFIRPWMIKLADDNYTLNVNLAKRLLDWEPKHSLDTSLPTIIQNMKKHPTAWYKENGLHPTKPFKKAKKKNKHTKKHEPKLLEPKLKKMHPKPRPHGEKRKHVR